MLARLRTLAAPLLAVALSLSALSLTPDHPSVGAAVAADPGEYLIGAGIADITGQAAETGMFGYANNRDANGIQQRLWSHAYVIASPTTGQRVVFVSADMGAMFQSVKLEVIKRLQARYGSTYTADNVMLTATHTHVGNAGQAHYALYELASADSSLRGFSKPNFEVAVDGIVDSIVRAHRSLAPGSVVLNTGELVGASKNRSKVAYDANVDAGSYPTNVNTVMTQLTLRQESGRELGLINWFSVHNTSLSNRFVQLSGDNKGYAQQQFERAKGSDPLDAMPFVAAFANSDEGDVVATDGNANSKPGFEGSPNELLNAERAGDRQFAKAMELYQSGGTILDGTVDYRHRWANFEDYTVDAAYTGTANTKLCTASRGMSFAAGAENGPSNIPGIYEGMTKGTFRVDDAVNKVDQSFLGATIRYLFGSVGVLAQDPCQSEKVPLLATGKANWVPEVLPFQIFRLGNLAIIGAPVEVTTMAGRRIRATVLDRLRGTGVDTAVIAGLANTYSGYLTTAEEFETQQYEGASTEFGPNTLAAYRQEYDRLAAAMAAGTAVTDDRQPPDLTGIKRGERALPPYDAKYVNEVYGGTLSEPKASYTAGETAVATFRGGHPKNNLMTGSSFLYVQRWNGSSWVNYKDDNDWETTYKWRREPNSERSVNTVEWRITAADRPGKYRLFHQGYYKEWLTGRIKPYQGGSHSFTVS